MLTFALALKAKGTPVPQIATKLTIKTGKNAGRHPSVASLYRALAEAESTRATPHPDGPLPQPSPAASRPTTDGAPEAAPTPTDPAPLAAPSPRACPTCGHEPTTRAQAIHQRADLDVTWLEPDRERPDQIATGRH
ncbi:MULTISPECIES: hypothetical protein [Rhodococcus]|uniref:Uncharacterized protein n=1 Tax=Rhodococcus oxybenzonivorans TaxID=1990687 RepID=A0AAE4V1S5_9NOCA|nr:MULTISPECIES: hypothetical protein [Rhodococcus]MDV7242248.1 hypothetical protein [Rhodococcus oxybenzonivorans]MDV7267251.1 hypothetical protein [Rhodococcus oxybenzonivorans]MDV7276256.1 hypothetical protein [Rhodococcus oxybenzonivorans]MDV7331736.1 hypothetical protein [Rhodococcus oxybenzonivorans]MDV7343958.1 hypothetical protein [Rhodococcus oxybenzonivorans]